MNHVSTRTSIIVTCHNYGRFLMQCLDSVLSQTLPFHEIILIDDDSKDATYEIWERFYKSRGVRYEKTALHSQMAVRNHGFKISTGDFLVFFDADDWLAPDYHEKMLRPLLKDPQIGFVYCGFEIERQALNSEAWFRSKEYVYRDYDFKRLWMWNYCSSASMARREAWAGFEKNYGHIMENGRAYGEDWDHWYTIAMNGWKAQLVRERLFYYRIHGENTSRPALENAETTKLAGWNIKQKYLPYDLTIVFIFSGRWKSMGQCLEYLASLKKPDATQIVIIDGSPRSSKPGLAASQCTDYVVFPRQSSYAEWKRRGLEESRYHVRGKKVLILTDRVCFGEDLYEQLAKGMAESNAQIYSPRIFEESRERVLVWRAVEGSARNGLYFIPVARQKKRVFAAGLDGTMMSAYVFHNFNLEYKIKNFIFAEILLGEWAGEKSIPWFVDGRIRSRRTLNYQHRKEVPGVSIIIPVRNGKSALPRLLKSLQAVEYPKDKMEILVVDNNSTDGTAEIAASFPGVKVLKETEKLSSYAARNKGIRESRHDLIAFVDADCEVTPGWLRELTEEICPSPWLGAVAGANRPRHENSYLSVFERKHSGYQNFWGNAEFPAYAITMNIIFRRRVFDEIGLFDDREISGSDTDMSWRLQFESAWKLKVLVDKAWVIHDDAVKLSAWFRRHLRIGHGFYGFYQKYPNYLSFSYYWFPLSKLELFIHCLRDFTKSTKERLKNGWKLWESVLFEVRTLAQKLGYQRALKRKIQEEKALPPPQSYKIFLGEKFFQTDGYDYKSLRYESENGTRVLYSEPSSYRYKNPLLQAVLSKLGVTMLWHWRPRLLSLEFWDLIPFCRSNKTIEQMNLEWNAARFRRALGMKPADVCRLSGHSPWDVLVRWKAALGQETQIEVFRQLNDLSLINAPVTACFLNKLDSFEELEAAEKISQVSRWPVILAGKFQSDSERAAIHNRIRKNPKIFFYEILNAADLEALFRISGICLAVSEKRYEEIRQSLPGNILVILKSESQKEEAGVVRCADFEDWERKTRAAFCYPKWPLPSATEKVSAPQVKSADFDKVTV